MVWRWWHGDMSTTLHNCTQYLLCTFNIALQYACSDWLLRGHYCLVMTEHYEIFSSARWLFWVVSKTTCAWAKTSEKMDKVQLTIFSITERKLAYRYFFSMSNKESHSTHKRMWKITSSVFIVFFLRTLRKIMPILYLFHTYFICYFIPITFVFFHYFPGLF